MGDNLSHNIPWYRTHKFWGIIFALIFSFSIFIFIQFLNKNGGNYEHSPSQIVSFAHMSFGASFAILVGFKIGSTVGGWIGICIYYATQSFLMLKTFRKSNVKLIYPTFFCLLYILGFLTAALTLS